MNISKGQRLHNLPKQLVLLLDHAHHKKNLKIFLLCLNGILCISVCAHCLPTSGFSFRYANSIRHLTKNSSYSSCGPQHCRGIRRALEATHNNTAEHTLSLEKCATSLPGHCCKTVITCTQQLTPAPPLKGFSHFWMTVVHVPTDKPHIPQPALSLLGVEKCLLLNRTEPFTP